MLAGTRIVPVISTSTSAGMRQVRSKGTGMGVGVGSGVAVGSFAIDPTDLHPTAKSSIARLKCIERMRGFYPLASNVQVENV